MNAHEGLASLVDNLLHQVNVGDAEPRFAMLETIRAFSLECLRTAGEEAQARRARHDYYLASVERVATGFAGPTRRAASTSSNRNTTTCEARSNGRSHPRTPMRRSESPPACGASSW